MLTIPSPWFELQLSGSNPPVLGSTPIPLEVVVTRRTRALGLSSTAFRSWHLGVQPVVFYLVPRLAQTDGMTKNDTLTK